MLETGLRISTIIANSMNWKTLFRNKLQVRKQGVNVMITIFGDFCHISAEKTGVFLKNHCYDQILAKTSSSLSKKTPIFSPNFSAKIFLKNHNIGPRSHIEGLCCFEIHMNFISCSCCLGLRNMWCQFLWPSIGLKNGGSVTKTVTESWGKSSIGDRARMVNVLWKKNIFLILDNWALKTYQVLDWNVLCK
jgi:hypothetical protein